MDDSPNHPDPTPLEESVGAGAGPEPIPPAEMTASMGPEQGPAGDRRAAAAAVEDAALRRRGFLHNLYLLLSLALAAFILTAWILVRVDSPFGIFSTGPQEIVRAQLLALDRDQLRPAYDMFSARYRQQVSFDVWHQLIVTHWRMFHAEVLRTGEPAQTGPAVTLEIHLRGADERGY